MYLFDLLLKMMIRESPMKTLIGFLSLTIFVSSASDLFAQEEGVVITLNEKQQVIDSVSVNLKEEYIFSDIAEKLVTLLNRKLEEGKYDHLLSHEEFASTITKDLRSVNNDKHLWIWYYPDWVTNELLRINNLSKGIDTGLEKGQKNNFGFKEIKIMDGNIGYFRLDEFSEYPNALQTLNGGFQFLQYCDALIIDLRHNIGGAPEMVQLLCSYFFQIPSVHLNSLKYKQDGDVVQYWTYYFLPGKKFINQPIYILVSGRTASAAEEFAYNLQTLKRATIIGEKTRGAAHHNKFKIINDNYFMSLPIARAVNPITHSNWEGAGIKPNIEVKSEIALHESYKSALMELLINSDNDDIKEKYQMVLNKLEHESKESSLMD